MVGFVPGEVQKHITCSIHVFVLHPHIGHVAIAWCVMDNGCSDIHVGCQIWNLQHEVIFSLSRLSSTWLVERWPSIPEASTLDSVCHDRKERQRERKTCKRIDLQNLYSFYLGDHYPMHAFKNSCSFVHPSPFQVVFCLRLKVCHTIFPCSYCTNWVCLFFSSATFWSQPHGKFTRIQVILGIFLAPSPELILGGDLGRLVVIARGLGRIVTFMHLGFLRFCRKKGSESHFNRNPYVMTDPGGRNRIFTYSLRQKSTKCIGKHSIHGSDGYGKTLTSIWWDIFTVLPSLLVF